MDVCLTSAKLVSEDFKNLQELPMDPSQLTWGFTGNRSVDDLGNDLCKFLNLDDDNNIVSGSLPVAGNSVDRKVAIFKDPPLLPRSTSEKFLIKSATFPYSNSAISFTAITSENKDKAGNGVDNKPSHQVVVQKEYITSDVAPCRTQSLPTLLKLVSAMKGSREKHGVTLKKLSVTWAADVYDPIPTAVSHVVTNKSQRHRNDSKRNSKNKQKGAGKPSRGSRRKDKQDRKCGGSSSRCFRSLDEDERMVDQVIQNKADVADYSIGNPDQYCGPSFLKNSISKMHFSVAEAT